MMNAPDKWQVAYQDKLFWLEMGIPFAESYENPNPMVFYLAMEWENVIPLLDRIAELEARLAAMEQAYKEGITYGQYWAHYKGTLGGDDE